MRSKSTNILVLLITLFIVFLLGISGWLFHYIITPQKAIADVSVILLEPANNSFLSGDIQITAQTDISVPKVEFHFVEESGKFTFIYEGTYIGDNQWQYTWSTDTSIDGVYSAYAVAVDSNNFTYLSEFNTIYVNNSGGSIPEPDQNTNGSPPSNNNINQNINGNENSNLNFNVNLNNNVNINLNTNNNENLNLNKNTNESINDNLNTSPPLNQNSNTNLNENININVNKSINKNTNTSLEETPPKPDEDNDDLPDDEEAKNGTNPTDPDSDDDGLTDGFELDNGFNPLEQDNDTPARTPDSTIINLINKASGSTDTDKDGIPDSAEIQIGTNPNDPDTSSDGLTDGFKAKNGYSLFTKNTNYIVKKKIDLPLRVEDSEESSIFSTVFILGVLLAVSTALLFLFRPTKGK